MQDIYQTRLRILQGAIILAALALLFKCFQIQIIDTSYQQQQSYRQALTLYPSRGLLYDRNDSLLIYNLPTYDILATYETVRRANIDTALFCELLGTDTATFVKNMEKNWSDRRFSKRKPITFMSRLRADSLAILQEHLYNFPGFELHSRNSRGYPVTVAAHALGYISEVNPEQIKASEGIYKRGDYIGISGLEQAYEAQLRGIKGKKQVLKDKWGRIKGSYKEGSQDVPAISGCDLITSIDLNLQRYAEELMQNKRGAVVVIQPSTGEILAMVSAPNYNPQLLTVDQDRQKAYLGLVRDSSRPLFNRALQAKYPPGSIFKPVLAAIALQEGVLQPNRGMGCPGGFIMGNRIIGCHGHAPTHDVAAAIQYSCNNYFCQTYREMVNIYGYDFPAKGMQLLSEHLEAFGLGRKLGIDIGGEASGNIPTVDYFNRRYGEGRWRFSHSVSIGIGQGELEVTPLQMANMAAIIANRGYYYTPHFAKELKGDTSNALAKFKKKHYTKVHPRHFEAVIDGMRRVILSGTGRRADIEDIAVCGKTGTVENVHGKDHSTFIAFAPMEKPEIVVAVYVENGGYGSTYGAPISSLIIEKHLRGHIESPQRQLLEKMMLEADLVSPPNIP